ncbi:endolytic transglycosylase MltG [Polycladidibacter stylochi]|uniref:endolytic transglycosylase MltG n=1 Tax=Polycladidibacter stylochi TaxID=1807766 RepID=UPI000831D152|nr:endolytic transglycosylase MltG [Pseudovibrio stylochi]
MAQSTDNGQSEGNNPEAPAQNNVEYNRPKSARQAIIPDVPPPPVKRKGRSPFIAILNFLLTLAVFAVIAAVVAIYIGKTSFDEPGPLKQETAFMVKSGARLRDIANELEARKIIRDAYIFEAGVRIYEQHAHLKAGEYALPAGVSMHKIMEILTSGKAIYYSITFPEGWTSKQIVQRINANKVLTGELKSTPDEGSLLPETYSFARGMTRQELVAKMQMAMKKQLALAWEGRDQNLPIKSPEELTTLASIVEKETGVAHERPMVAAVFVNRLRKKMPLQSDPTILYGLYGGDAWTKDRSAIKRSELKAKNPYNTYQIRALPPGPIGNPGRDALNAVANPANTKDLYFVADGTGGHIFAQTYKQHQRNVVKWRKIEREKRRKQAEEKKNN